jgi:iron-sulfur cluster repair protein YtfE (RIC family)
MNAIELLKADHQVVEGLFEEVEDTEAGEHPGIFERIKAELTVHAHIEESIFYPALQEDGDEALVELTSEALKEHSQTKVFLGELDVVASDIDKFESLLIKLIEEVRHHVEEEEGVIFPAVEEQFDVEILQRWGTQMKAEKDRFQESSESAYA